MAMIETINLTNSTSAINTLTGNYIGLTNSTGTITNYYAGYIAAPTGSGVAANPIEAAL